MVELLLDEPLCWGMHGAPLVPPQLSKFAAAHVIDISRTRRNAREIDRRPLDRLCSENWVISSDWGLTPLDFAESLADPLIRAHQVFEIDGIHGFSPYAPETDQDQSLFEETTRFDVPLCVKAITGTTGLSELPLLLSTWEEIDGLALDTKDLAQLLRGGSVLDALQLGLSVRSVFDLSVTANQWVTDRGRVFKPNFPTDLAGAFKLIKSRHVLQGSPIPVKSSDDLDRLVEIVGRERGRVLNLEGSPMTLEDIGMVLDLTRERIRQLETKYRLKHQIVRRWPLPPLLEQLLSKIESLVGRSLEESDQLIRDQFGEFGDHATSAAIALLCAYGHAPSVVQARGKLLPTAEAMDLPCSETEIKRASRAVAGALGFVRIDDVVDHLINEYPAAPRASVRSAIIDSATIAGLPDDYLFVRNLNRSHVTGSLHRMLGCTNPLSINDLRSGLDRMVAFHKLEPLPPNDVLLAFLRNHPSFTVEGDYVESLDPILPVEGGHVEWMLKKIDSTGFQCIHKSRLFTDARLEGRNQSSISVYCSLYEQFTSLPLGCIGRIGQHPRPELIEMAAQQARLVRIDSSFKFRDLGSKVIVTAVVGNSFRDNGVFLGNPSLRARLKPERLPVFAGHLQHGHLSVSGSNIFSLVSAFNAMGVELGDAIEVTIDFEVGRVDVEFAQGSDDE